MHMNRPPNRNNNIDLFDCFNAKGCIYLLVTTCTPPQIHNA